MRDVMKGDQQPGGPPVVEVLGVDITDEPPSAMVDRALADLAQNGVRRTVLAMHITALNSIDEPGLRSALGSADYLHADGVSVALLAKLGGARQLAAVPTTDLGPEFLSKFTIRRGRPPRVAIIGGEPGIADKAMQALVDRYQVQPVFIDHGFHDDWPNVLSGLREAEPDIVFIGLGMPLEAFWVQQWLTELPDALIITCGGWLRLLSGDEVRAPLWLVRIHLEFTWRWATDFGRTNERYSRGVATVARGSIDAVKSRLQARRTRKGQDRVGSKYQSR